MFNRYGRQNIYHAVSGLLNLGLGIALGVSDEQTGAKVHALRFGLAFITFINYQLIKYNLKYSPTANLSLLPRDDERFGTAQKAIKRNSLILASLAGLDATTGVGTEIVTTAGKDAVKTVSVMTKVQGALDLGNSFLSVGSSLYSFISNLNRHRVEEARKSQLDYRAGEPTDSQVQDAIADEVHATGVQEGCFDRMFRRIGF